MSDIEENTKPFGSEPSKSAETVKRRQELLELELREEKADTQKRMAWTALLGMILVTICLFFPIFPDSRIAALAELLGLFYIALAGVVGAYMGFTTWMTRK